MPAARVLIVDDHPVIRDGIETMLKSQAGLEAVGSTGRSRQALELAKQVDPDVVLVDYQLPDDDGLWLCLRLKTSVTAPKVLMYSAFADDTLVLLAAICGIDGLVSKSALASELCDSLRAVAAGKALLPAPSPATMQSAGSRIDANDLPIVGMLIHGMPPSEIADTLSVEEATLAQRRWTILERIRERPAHRL